jgi:hypothetical protein
VAVAKCAGSQTTVCPAVAATSDVAVLHYFPARGRAEPIRCVDSNACCVEENWEGRAGAAGGGGGGGGGDGMLQANKFF